ncbi:ArsR/SmtB family transcription factor [Bifidobacterium criceti]|uniref:ArsR family transcriptional regulator n=1 Tax=Bifidobacterium criceti TaxID=1960969 RepID=A0A2A2EGN9_9BIFI|nr:helix-turn-helix domain-containing protein [Bifidobacterium criceti]PAU68075.1 ArsR family transcriptional regulator [Bifidobacterium criceti]
MTERRLQAAERSTITNQEEASAASEEALKCMAHPARMRLLGALRVGDVQTVGELSAATGEAPGAVSYHLAQLAKAGLVEKAVTPDGDRRKSHWRACHHATNVRPDSADADVIDAFSRTAALSYQMAYERFLDVLPTLPQQWVDTCGANDRVLRLTPDETRAMVEQLNEVMRTWEHVSERRRMLIEERDRAHINADDSADIDDIEDADVEPVAIVQQVFRWVP